MSMELINLNITKLTHVSTFQCHFFSIWFKKSAKENDCNINCSFQNQQEDSPRASIPTRPCHALSKQKGRVGVLTVCFTVKVKIRRFPVIDSFVILTVDDSEGAAGVEDSSVHFQLEERKGDILIVNLNLFQTYLH